jgi:hypothetical protein
MRECVEGETVHSNRDGRGEHGTLIECEPMSIMVIGNGRLNYSETPPSTLSFIPSNRSKKYHFQYVVRQRTRQMELKECMWDQ